MVEDIELNALIKDAFEGEVTFAFAERKAAPKKRRWTLYWSAPSMLVAASLAIVAMFQVVFTPAPDRVSEAIRFLSEVDGVEMEESASSPEALLLAWQEAPLFVEVAVNDGSAGL